MTDLTISTISFSISGLDVSGISAVFVAGVNTLPTISIRIVDSTTEGTIEVHDPTLKDTVTLYSKLAALARGLNTQGTITIKFGADEDNPALKLEKWYLTDVNVETITTSDAPNITVSFMHPAVKLLRSGQIYESPKSTSFKNLFTSCSGSSVISLMDSVYEAYASETGITFLTPANVSNGGVDGQLQEKIKKYRTELTENKPGTYLTDETQKLFLSSALEKTDALKRALILLVKPTEFCNSTWERLVTELSGDLFIQVSPTYDQPKLKVEPINPWKKPKYRMQADDIETIRMTAMDPSPIAGTAMPCRTIGVQVTDDANRTTTTPKECLNLAFYMPSDATSKDGQIISLGSSRVIDAVLSYDLGAAAGATGAQNKLSKISNGVEPSDINKLNKAYAEASFMTYYRNQCVTTITCPLTFVDSDDNRIYPGECLTVEDKEGEKLVDGFVTRISATISTKGGNTTEIQLSHTRPSSEEGMLIKKGAKNPCY